MKKPELSYKKKKEIFTARNRKLIEFLREKRSIAEIQYFLGEITNRRARHKLEELRKYYALISYSSDSGYRIASLDDLDEINHTINEFKSRKDEYDLNMKPLIALKKVIEKNQTVTPDYIQKVDEPNTSDLRPFVNENPITIRGLAQMSKNGRVYPIGGDV
jgi:queuine/archaeosine tRNA-ribosyltransferase